MKDFPNLNTKEPDGISANGKPYTIMVVDGKEFQRKQIAQIFESEQYRVVETAANGKEALEKYDKLKGKIDLITTELDMPVLDGYAMLYELKQRNCSSLVVFISEETTKGVMQDLIQMGVKDFILKPVNRRVLLERVKNVLTKYYKPAQSLL
ncbi:MAG TPA: response regulator [Spirochaetota bacterium]|nr:response regulator [Spirochaetota bacterium]HPJ33940.1 response regulator [Spirochaetota bacterium]